MNEPHVVVTCDQCGCANRVERVILTPQTVRIICHRCEAPQTAELTEAHLAAAQRALAGTR